MKKDKSSDALKSRQISRVNTGGSKKNAKKSDVSVPVPPNDATVLEEEEQMEKSPDNSPQTEFDHLITSVMRDRNTTAKVIESAKKLQDSMTKNIRDTIDNLYLPSIDDDYSDFDSD